MTGRARLLALVLLAATAGAARAQWTDVPAFAGGAVLFGAQGFARPPITSAVGTAYAHIPAGPGLLVGAQGGITFAEPDHSHAKYAIATIAYAQRRGVLWQVYPYIGAGAAVLRTTPGSAHWRPAFAAGFGVDALSGTGALGTMIGARIGYLTRGLEDDESVAYAAIGIGLGGRRGDRHEPRTIARR